MKILLTGKLKQVVVVNWASRANKCQEPEKKPERLVIYCMELKVFPHTFGQHNNRKQRRGANIFFPYLVKIL